MKALLSDYVEQNGDSEMQMSGNAIFPAASGSNSSSSTTSGSGSNSRACSNAANGKNSAGGLSSKEEHYAAFDSAIDFDKMLDQGASNFDLGGSAAADAAGGAGVGARPPSALKKPSMIDQKRANKQVWGKIFAGAGIETDDAAGGEPEGGAGGEDSNTNSAVSSNVFTAASSSSYGAEAAAGDMHMAKPNTVKTAKPTQAPTPNFRDFSEFGMNPVRAKEEREARERIGKQDQHDSTYFRYDTGYGSTKYYR